MSGFASQASGIAASVYLGLYSIFLAFMTYVVAKRGFKTLFTFIFVFCVLRVGGQLCGVVYAQAGPQYYKWLIAYLVLQAEGYFTLILTCFRFTCKAQLEEHGSSWVTTTGPQTPLMSKWNITWMNMFHYILVPANAFLIAGGSMTAGIDPTDASSYTNKIHIARGLRTAGQIIFLLMTLISISVNMHVFLNERIRNRTTISVMLAGPFLIVRGVFGVLSIYIDDMNYFDLSNYMSGGVNKNLVIYEYVLATTMEFLTAVILMTRFFVSPPVHKELVQDDDASSSSKEYLCT
ncbi:hypothetical protein JCM33374_g2078 [Metschnikowia sp. JCM 33374]|nr:hypothetical protein JCM33374_g2078 [Metschnikowia sp. JCM 33374]